MASTFRKLLFLALVPAAFSAAGSHHEQPFKRNDSGLSASGQAGSALLVSPRYADSSLPSWLTEPLSLNKRATCTQGKVYCSTATDDFCMRCGTCCGGGKCAWDFGNCCAGGSTYCDWGFSCCPVSGCCHTDTSFCCSTSSNGCCKKGTVCGSNGCEGTATFVIEAVSTTTTYFTTDYISKTTTTTSYTTFVQTTVKFSTSTVISSGLDTATSVVFETSTRFTKRDVLELPTPTPTPTPTPGPAFRRGAPYASPEAPKPRALTAGPLIPGIAAAQDGLAAIGILNKRLVTSYAYIWSFVWVGYTSTTTIYRTTFLPVTNLVTSTSIITSVSYTNARTTVVVTSTIVITLPSGGGTTIVDSGPTSSDKGISVNPADSTDSGSGGKTTSRPGESAGIGGSGGSVSGNGTTVVVAPAPGSSDLSTAAKAGIGAGAGIGAIALALGAFALGHKLRSRNKNGSSDSGTTAAMSIAPMSPAPMMNTPSPGFGGSNGGGSTLSWTPPPPPQQAFHSGNWQGGGPPPAAAFAVGGAAAGTSAAAMAARNSHPHMSFHSTSSLGGRPGGSMSPEPGNGDGFNGGCFNRGASPVSTGASEIMTTGYTVPIAQAVEVGSSGVGSYGGGNPQVVVGGQHHEMPTGDTRGYYTEYTEMPATPMPSHPPPAHGQWAAQPGYQPGYQQGYGPGYGQGYGQG